MDDKKRFVNDVKAQIENGRQQVENDAEFAALFDKRQAASKKVSERGEEIAARQKRGQLLLDYLASDASALPFQEKVRWLGKNSEMELSDFCLFRIHELTFEEKAPRREAMENILGTFRGMEGISFLYLILGNASGVEFYFGVAY